MLAKSAISVPGPPDARQIAITMHDRENRISKQDRRIVTAFITLARGEPDLLCECHLKSPSKMTLGYNRQKRGALNVYAP